MQISPVSRQMFSRSPLFFLLIALSPFVCGFFWLSPTWESILSTIADRYPQVHHITPEALFHKMKSQRDDGTVKMVLIDVREPDEFAVSHLAGAIRRTDPNTIDLPKDQFIVVYCSVGLRSAGFASRLMRRGYTNVLNLQESIFGWANRGFPVYQGKQQVHAVHPYNRRWGVLLNSKYHSYEPD